jgi:hypothetical protein
MRIVVFILLILIYGCKSKQEKLKERMVPVLTSLILKDSTIKQIDSLVIFEVDTLTDLKYNKRLIGIMNSHSDYFVNMAKIENDKTDSYLNLLRSSKSSAQLYYNVLDSKTLGDMEMDKFREYNKKVSESIKAAQGYIDSSKLMDSRIAAMTKSIKEHKVDSTNFKGYIPWFRILGSDKDGIQIKRDSMYVYLSDQMSIIKVEEK